MQGIRVQYRAQDGNLHSPLPFARPSSQQLAVNGAHVAAYSLAPISSADDSIRINTGVPSRDHADG